MTSDVKDQACVRDTYCNDVLVKKVCSYALLADNLCNKFQKKGELQNVLEELKSLRSGFLALLDEQVGRSSPPWLTQQQVNPNRFAKVIVNTKPSGNTALPSSNQRLPIAVRLAAYEEQLSDLLSVGQSQSGDVGPSKANSVDQRATAVPERRTHTSLGSGSEGTGSEEQGTALTASALAQLESFARQQDPDLSKLSDFFKGLTTEAQAAGSSSRPRNLSKKQPSYRERVSAVQNYQLESEINAIQEDTLAEEEAARLDEEDDDKGSQFYSNAPTTPQRSRASQDIGQDLEIHNQQDSYIVKDRHGHLVHHSAYNQYCSMKGYSNADRSPMQAINGMAPRPVQSPGGSYAPVPQGSMSPEMVRAGHVKPPQLVVNNPAGMSLDLDHLSDQSRNGSNTGGPEGAVAVVRKLNLAGLTSMPAYNNMKSDAASGGGVPQGYGRDQQLGPLQAAMRLRNSSQGSQAGAGAPGALQTQHSGSRWSSGSGSGPSNANPASGGPSRRTSEEPAPVHRPAWGSGGGVDGPSAGHMLPPAGHQPPVGYMPQHRGSGGQNPPPQQYLGRPPHPPQGPGFHQPWVPQPMIRPDVPQAGPLSRLLNRSNSSGRSVGPAPSLLPEVAPIPLAPPHAHALPPHTVAMHSAPGPSHSRRHELPLERVSAASSDATKSTCAYSYDSNTSQVSQVPEMQILVKQPKVKKKPVMPDFLKAALSQSGVLLPVSGPSGAVAGGGGEGSGVATAGSSHGVMPRDSAAQSGQVNNVSNAVLSHSLASIAEGTEASSTRASTPAVGSSSVGSVNPEQRSPGLTNSNQNRSQTQSFVTAATHAAPSASFQSANNAPPSLVTAMEHAASPTYATATPGGTATPGQTLMSQYSDGQSVVGLSTAEQHADVASTGETQMHTPTPADSTMTGQYEDVQSRHGSSYTPSTVYNGAARDGDTMIDDNTLTPAVSDDASISAAPQPANTTQSSVDHTEAAQEVSHGQPQPRELNAVTEQHHEQRSLVEASDSVKQSFEFSCTPGKQDSNVSSSVKEPGVRSSVAERARWFAQLQQQASTPPLNRHASPQSSFTRGGVAAGPNGMPRQVPGVRPGPNAVNAASKPITEAVVVGTAIMVPLVQEKTHVFSMNTGIITHESEGGEYDKSAMHLRPEDSAHSINARQQQQAQMMPVDNRAISPTTGRMMSIPGVSAANIHQVMQAAPSPPLSPSAQRRLSGDPGSSWRMGEVVQAQHLQQISSEMVRMQPAPDSILFQRNMTMPARVEQAHEQEVVHQLAAPVSPRMIIQRQPSPARVWAPPGVGADVLERQRSMSPPPKQVQAVSSVHTAVTPQYHKNAEKTSNPEGRIMQRSVTTADRHQADHLGDEHMGRSKNPEVEASLEGLLKQEEYVPQRLSPSRMVAAASVFGAALPQPKTVLAPPRSVPGISQAGTGGGYVGTRHGAPPPPPGPPPPPPPPVQQEAVMVKKPVQMGHGGSARGTPSSAATENPSGAYSSIVDSIKVLGASGAHKSHLRSLSKSKAKRGAKGQALAQQTTGAVGALRPGLPVATASLLSHRDAAISSHRASMQAQAFMERLKIAMQPNRVSDEDEETDEDDDDGWDD